MLLSSFQIDQSNAEALTCTRKSYHGPSFSASSTEPGGLGSFSQPKPEYGMVIPPTFITTGTRDLLLSDAVRISAGMQSDGVEVTLRIWEGMWHVFEFYRELPEARASMAQVCEWIRSRLN